MRGPVTYRWLLKPAVAAHLRLEPARAMPGKNRSRYFWALLHDPSYCGSMLGQGWHDVSKVLLHAIGPYRTAPAARISN